MGFIGNAIEIYLGEKFMPSTHCISLKGKKKFLSVLYPMQCMVEHTYNSLTCSLRSRRYIHHVTHKLDFLQNEVLDLLLLWGM